MKEKEIYSAHLTRKKIRKAIFAISALVLLFFLFIGFSIYSEYLEIQEIGSQFVGIFFKRLFTQILFSSAFFVLCFGLVAVNTGFIKKNLNRAGVIHSIFEHKILLILIQLAISFFVSQYMSASLHEKFLAYQNSTDFNLKDPILGLELSFYIFRRPFWNALVDSVFSVLVLVEIYSLISYILLYIKMGERDISDLFHEKNILLHIAIQLFVLLAFLAVSVWFDAQEILTGRFMQLTGGGFVDINLWFNFYRFAPLLIIFSAFVALYFLVKKRYIKAIAVCCSYFAVLLLVGVVAWVVQMVYVSPNEVTAEKKYIEHNIHFTRFGYGIDHVEEYEYPVLDTADASQFNMENETIKNIRIIDFPATITATNQLQGIRGYYKFNDMNVGYYDINGKKKAVAIGVREIYKDNLEESSKNYLNEKFRYTHGFGLAMAEMDSVTPKGQPKYLIENLVPESATGAPEITQPRIYFGELTNDDVIVNTDIPELDYSEGTTDAEFNYDGNAGIQMTFLNRLLFAFKTGDLRMLIAGQISNESRLLTNRNVLQRVKKAAPFFKYDNDPTIVIDNDGTLKWVIDGYTTSDALPYSQYTDGYNYIRNAFKVVVDAYSGDVKFYVIDSSDPIVRTYRKIYPSLFEKHDMPDSLKQKTKYPESLFKTQCNIYTQYHVTNPGVFYNKSDLYAVANEKYEQNTQPLEPYYSVMKLDEFNRDTTELVLMLPFTISKRANMVSWIAVGNEGENYGKLIAYKFPKNKTVYGPMQIENMIDNDPGISKEMTLWNSGGSNVIRGNLLVIPVNDTILYVEPVYITSNNEESLPLLQRVIVGFGENIVMSDSLEDALLTLFGSSSAQKEQNPASTDTEPTTPDENDVSAKDEKIQAVADAYHAVEKSASEGDWTAFGKSMQALEQAISDLEK